MDRTQVGSTVEHARLAAGLSQRALSSRTGISQSTLSRIISGARAAKLPELMRIANATGYTVGQLAGTSIASRVQCAARATNGATMTEMKAQLLHLMEINQYLDDQAVPAPR